VSELDTYAADRQRHLPVLWLPLKATPDVPAALDRLIEAAQSHVLDWPARTLHAPIENGLARALLPTVVSATLVTALAALLGAGAMLAFAMGWLWLGLVLMLLLGPLDGLDVKLARIRGQPGQARFRAVMVGFTEVCLILGLGLYFSRQGFAAAWPLCAIILGASLAGAAQRHFFRRFTGRALEDWAPLERKIRLFSAHRNMFVFVLLVFAAFDAWWTGYKFIALYAGVTFFLAQFRFFVRLKEYGESTCKTVAANFERTHYGFLRQRKTDIRDARSNEDI
jgi:1L-myo-inositol 1-phosphate cytidylyltransferase / CDP-L-myo-inositol myo-inositolphosphotransferase